MMFSCRHEGALFLGVIGEEHSLDMHEHFET